MLDEELFAACVRHQRYIGACGGEAKPWSCDRVARTERHAAIDSYDCLI